MNHVSLVTAFRQACKDRGLTYGEVARAVGVAEKTIARYACGANQFPLDLLPILCRFLGHPAFISSVINEVSGGIGPFYLDGPKAEHHKSVGTVIVHHEIEELHAAMERAETRVAMSPGPDALDAEGNKLLEVLMGELMDIRTGAFNLMADLCSAYEKSMYAVADRHRLKLELRGLVAKGEGDRHVHQVA